MPISCELFDFASQTWHELPSPGTAGSNETWDERRLESDFHDRDGCCVAVLDDGRVLITGGCAPTPYSGEDMKRVRQGSPLVFDLPAWLSSGPAGRSGPSSRTSCRL